MTVYIIAQQVYDLENWLLSKLVSYTLIIIGIIANWNIIHMTILYYVTIFIYTYFCFKLNNFLISNKIHHSPVDFILLIQCIISKHHKY